MELFKIITDNMDEIASSFVYMHPLVIRQMKLGYGGVIEINHTSTGKSSAAYVIPSIDKSIKYNSITINEGIRNIINAKTGDRVMIYKINAPNAEIIWFGLLKGDRGLFKDNYIALALENKPVKAGNTHNIIRNNRKYLVIVVGYTPKAKAVKIQLNTVIKHCSIKDYISLAN